MNPGSQARGRVTAPMSKNYSQTSRDRLVANMLVALPVIAVLIVIRHYQKPDAPPLTP